MKILEILDHQSMNASTDSLDISFGELASMYPEELEIRPVYQRLFRWSIRQQSQLIESLLLGLPIPPIFVIETESRKYELIDGLQRISTYLHFNGTLDSERYPKGHKFKLTDCEIVSELNGLKLDDLPMSLKVKIKRSYVKMYIIKKESPKRLKYDMFKRLNTGGSLLSEQEIRNSTIRFLSETFIDAIQKLKKDTNFKQCISAVNDYQIARQFDDELILRFFTIKNADLDKYHSQQDGDTLSYYMTKYAEDVASDIVSFDYDLEILCFQNTFKILNKTLGRHAFSQVNQRDEFSDQFLAFHFEAITVAVSKYHDKIDSNNAKHIATIKSRLIELKKNKSFLVATENKTHKRTSGSDYLKFLKERIKIAKKVISGNE